MFDVDGTRESTGSKPKHSRKEKFRFPFLILLYEATILRCPTSELERPVAFNRILMSLHCGS